MRTCGSINRSVWRALADLSAASSCSSFAIATYVSVPVMFQCFVENYLEPTTSTLVFSGEAQ